MKTLLSCEFNIDTACVELKYADGTMISIDTIAVENEFADNMHQRSELDWLIYNKPCRIIDASATPAAGDGCGRIHGAFYYGKA